MVESVLPELGNYNSEIHRSAWDGLGGTSIMERGKIHKPTSPLS